MLIDLFDGDLTCSSEVAHCAQNRLISRFCKVYNTEATLSQEILQLIVRMDPGTYKVAVD